MKKFVKDKLSTIVEDNDRRISAYIAGGWKEEEVTPVPMDAADNLLDKAIDEVNESEQRGDSGESLNNTPKKATAPTQKINDAISAKATAATESAVVDDGLFKREEK